MKFRKMLALWSVLLYASCIRSTNEFKDVFLATINTFRKLHGCPKLHLNEDLCASANEHAKKGSLERSGDNQTSELLCDSYNPLECVDDWHYQEKYYDYKEAKYIKEAEYYTLMIWKSSKEFGLGKCLHISGVFFVVVKIIPRGNIEGMFMENVPKEISASSSPIKPISYKHVLPLSIMFPALAFKFL
ncbi:Golgi-associated plant pathogenesis-related protein 1-like isoform X2 [Drosophila montana]|uniref:Golgi-associated plant pathogenesis-related protein 1-like isoform X2 n=1 Tax=Drosophila montana TaxID=40370 RepID=UPI00313F3B47